MAVVLNNQYNITVNEQHKEVQKMVLAGLGQIREGRTKDLDEVCDRLEKKYRNVSIQNQNKNVLGR